MGNKQNTNTTKLPKTTKMENTQDKQKHNITTTRHKLKQKKQLLQYKKN